MTDEDILQKFWNRKHSTLKRFVNKGMLEQQYYDYLVNRYNDCDDIVEALYRIKHNIDHRPICPICGKQIVYNHKLNMFNQYCSRICANKNPELIQHRKETFIKEYGCEVPQRLQSIKDKVSNTWSTKTKNEIVEIIERAKHTKLKRYGDKRYVNVEKANETKIKKYGSLSYYNIDKAKQTKLKRYGDENYVNVDKAKQTKLKRYGDENYVNVDKAKQTKLKRYGDENYVNVDKIKQTCYERYGTYFYTQSSYFKTKIEQTCYNKYGVKSVLCLTRDKSKHLSKESRMKAVNTSKERFGSHNYNNRIKYTKTCLKKYGVSHFSQTLEYKEKQSIIMSSNDIQKRRYNTMKRNKSFNISQTENQTFNILKTRFSDLVSQYKSEQYPFCCDFYVPSNDLYIECNYHWTHGGHPYNKNDEQDKEKVDHWMSKHTKYYDNAINTWTKLDVRKRMIAKENKLNYIELWNINEAKDFVKTWK